MCQETVIRIRSLGNEGQGIGTLESGKTVFAKGALPGEECRVRITRETSKFAEADVIEITKGSEYRVSPFIPQDKVSGGLPLAALEYSKQLEYKQNKVRDCLTRIAGIENADKLMRPIEGAKDNRRYRNHMQYAIKDGKVGLLISGSHELGIFDEELIEYEIASLIRHRIEKAFERAPTRLLTGLVLRASQRTKEVLVEFVSSNPGPHETLIRDITDYLTASKITEGIKEVCGNEGFTLKGILLRISPDKTSIRTRGGKRVAIEGEDFLDEIFCGRRLRIKAGSFFQVNTEQAEILARLASMQMEDAKVIYDLYCGCGTLGMGVKREGQKIVGIEAVPEAIESAKINRKLAFPSEEQDLTYICRDVLKTDFRDLIKKGKIDACDALITDPPRKGMDQGVIRKILELAPPKLVYVSCEAATLARDLKLLTKDYDIQSVTPVDLFPNAAGVETVVLLSREKVDGYINIDY
ncbi:MAG: 23S rRNA (uracil(1939)-C(5))-methyltransferase RlmD [Saccharofermentans sp.]|nr:23S rRNA (uracil(1939)-C(5))-methyltransferase RlmD [Saccharofermentans sp.]